MHCILPRCSLVYISASLVHMLPVLPPLSNKRLSCSPQTRLPFSVRKKGRLTLPIFCSGQSRKTFRSGAALLLSNSKCIVPYLAIKCIYPSARAPPEVPARGILDDIGGHSVTMHKNPMNSRTIESIEREELTSVKPSLETRSAKF